MHGVKRLFAWMIPRFDKARFNVSLISLRKKDLSADTLEEVIDYFDSSAYNESADGKRFPIDLNDNQKEDLLEFLLIL